MKKGLFSLMIVCFAFASNAQQGFFIGLDGQGHGSFILNQNSFGYNYEPDYKFTIGFGTALKLGYMINEMSGLQFELGYNKMGQNYSDNFTYRPQGATSNVTSQFDKNIDLSYITFGVMYRLTLAKKDFFNNYQKVRFTFVGGLQMGVLSFADFKVAYGGVEQFNYPIAGILAGTNLVDYAYEAKPADDKDFFNKVDVGLVVQPGVDFYATERLFITLALRAYLGILDINADEYTLHPNYAASRNFNMGLRVGIGYNITYK